MGVRDLSPRAMMAGLVLAFGLMAAQPGLARGPESVSSLAGPLVEAVVNISTTRSIGGAGLPYPEVPPGSPLEDLLNQNNPNSGQGEQAMRQARSLGSGFIVDETGIIVTNNHVIDGAEQIVVFTHDGRRYDARILGADDKTDLAVLKIEPKVKLAHVAFGDSDTAKVGDWVMAIGNPFGLGGSVTLGIVSARDRNINSGPYDDFIQTDAAINQGNSGGPLFDMDGNVVGINTAIISQTGGALGIGFAVPANLAKGVVAQLIKFGETRRGWLGVGIQEVNQDIAASLGRDNADGAMVVDVTKGGPSVGVLEEGDIVLQFDGRRVAEMHDLPRLVAQTEVGKSVDLLILRQGREMTVPVVLGRLESVDAQPAAPEVLPMNAPAEPDANAVPSLSDLVGFEADNLTDQLRKDYDLKAGAGGVLVSSVRPGSDAADKGITAGLIISEVNQQKVTSAEQVTRLIDQAREAGRPAVLFKMSDVAGNVRFVAVRLN